jgi:hypothetical protein
VAASRAATGRAVGVAALVARSAQERVDLGLQRGLQQQPHADAGDVFQDRGQVTPEAKSSSASAPSRWVGDTPLDTGVDPFSSWSL